MAGFSAIGFRVCTISVRLERIDLSGNRLGTCVLVVLTAQCALAIGLVPDCVSPGVLRDARIAAVTPSMRPGACSAHGSSRDVALVALQRACKEGMIGVHFPGFVVLGPEPLRKARQNSGLDTNER